MSDFAYPLHEECGVFGIYDRAGTEDVAAAAYSALYALQHRGQESCGIAVNDDGVIEGHRDLGLVNEVFTPAVLTSLAKPTAHMATGHVRYATSGSRVRANAQPMIVRHGRGTMALCHNGNLTNALELRRQLENEGAIFHGSSDTEVICYLVTRNRLRMGSIETAISKTMDVLEGAYLDAYILNLELHIFVVRSADIIEWLGNTVDTQVGCIAGCLVELYIVDGEPVLILVAEGIEAQIDGLWLVELDYLERLLVSTLLNGLLINLAGHIGRGVSITIIYAQLLGVSVGTGIPIAQYVVASLYLHWVENCPVVGIVLLIIIIGKTGYACACHIHPKV